jgi:ribosomal protein S18 acetylase RimI-like enzyme
MALDWAYSTGALDWDELCALYEASPPMGGKNVADLQTSFGNSMFKCFVYDGARLVGAGRALADGIACSYIADVAVLPEYRGSGLGKQVVAELLRLPAGHKRIILYAVPGKEPFYQKFGFRRMRTAMAIFDNQAAAAERGYIDAE